MSSESSSPFLPYGRHHITAEDIAAVTEVLKGSWLTQGPHVQDFEKAIAKVAGTNYAVAFTNGTAALHISVKALDLPAGSKVIVPAITFAASANCCLYNGIDVVFADVEPESGLIDLAHVEELLTAAKSNGDVISAVIPVHYAGNPVDLEGLRDLQKKFAFKVIEDAAHAVGAEDTKGRPIGSHPVSSMAMFSFHPVKHITTGEGGAIVTNDVHLRDRLQVLRSHGIDKDPKNFLNPHHGIDAVTGLPNPWYHEMQDLGFNYRLPDILAALGTSQLKRLPDVVEKRRNLAAVYANQLSASRFCGVVGFDGYGKSAFHLQVISLTDPKLIKEKGRLMRMLFERNIGTQVHYIPVPMHPYYERKGYLIPEKSAAFYHSALTLPLFPEMTSADVSRVVKSLNDVASQIQESSGVKK